MARVTSSLDVVYVEIGAVHRIPTTTAYKVYSADWLRDAHSIAFDPRRKHLAPFILAARKRLEIEE